MKTIIVIGAGIAGAASAYHLARCGANVTLIDRGDKGQATAAAAGIIAPWLSQRRNKSWYQLVKNGARYYPKLIDKLAEDGEYETGYKKTGVLCLHEDSEKLHAMEKRAYERREEAPEIGEISRLSPDEAKKIYPPLADGTKALFVSGGARVDGKLLTKAMINAALKNGVRFLSGEAKLLHQGTKVIGAEVNGEKLMADEVIAACGAWGKQLVLPNGYELQAFPQKAQIVHLHLPVEQTKDWPVVMPTGNKYLVAFEGGEVVIGSTHEDTEVFNSSVTAGGVAEILQRGLEIAPGLSEAEVSEIRVGFRPVTPGFIPVFGRPSKIEGLLIVNGLGSSGLTAGPYIGAELARMALGQAAELDLTNYDVDKAMISPR